MDVDLKQLAVEVERGRPVIQKCLDEVGKVIVGQSYLVDRLMMGLLADGHILVEGVPGLAKTTAVKSLAAALHASFQSIQFTPDLLPADILGTQVYSPKTQDFHVKKGPLFHQIILADEINRAPAKVQSALLEAMQERQVTIGEETFPLPEAQIDRFMLKLRVTYPSKGEELEIMNRFVKSDPPHVEPVLDPATILSLRHLIRQIHLDPKINDYIVRIVFATRDPRDLKLQLERYIRYGASPRASIYLNLVSKAYAFMQGRSFVVPQDVKTMAVDVLRHRILVSFEAEAEGKTPDDILKQILDHFEVP